MTNFIFYAVNIWQKKYIYLTRPVSIDKDEYRLG